MRQVVYVIVVVTGLQEEDCQLGSIPSTKASHVKAERKS